MSNPYLNWDQERGHADPQNPESQTPEEIAREIVPIGLQVSTGVVADLRDAIAAVIRSEREQTRAERDKACRRWDERETEFENELASEREKCEAMREAISRTLDDFTYLENKYKAANFYSTDIGYVLKPRVLELIDAVGWLPPAPKEVKRCAYGDPFCPCQDGDTCHYEGSNAMRPKKAQS